MTELVGWTTAKLETEDLHPLINVAIFIVVFLKIHPFQDGNGRVSRILTTLLLLRAGYVYVPYSSLETVIERERIILGDLPKLSVQILELLRGPGYVVRSGVTG